MCCKRHQNVELQFTTVQTRQEDDLKNRLNPDKTDIAAVLRAIRAIQTGESIRYQQVDNSEQTGNTPKCECYLHIGLCQPQMKETMLERMASVPTQSFPETRQPTIGAPVTVYTGGDAQKWRVNHIKQGIGTLIKFEFENSTMIVDKSWFMFDRLPSTTETRLLQRYCSQTHYKLI